MKRYISNVEKLSDLGTMVDNACEKGVEWFLICFCAACGEMLLFDIGSRDDNDPLFCVECDN